MTFRSFLLSSLIAGAVAVPATANPIHPKTIAGETRFWTTVSYGDLNLASADGKAAFDRRIRVAVTNVCRRQTVDAALGAMNECRSSTFREIKPQMLALIDGANNTQVASIAQ